jgi:hypothetical protein
VSKVRYLWLALLIFVDLVTYALVLGQWMALARGEALVGSERTATFMRVVPALAIPGIAVVAAALTYWRSGRNKYLTALMGAICVFIVNCLAIWWSIPVA